HTCDRCAGFHLYPLSPNQRQRVLQSAQRGLEARRVLCSPVGMVPAVRASGQRNHARTFRGDPQRWRGRGDGERGVLQPEPRPIQGYWFPTEEPLERFKGFFQPADPMVERQPECIELGLVSAGAQAEDEATLAGSRERRRLTSELDHVSEGVTQDECPDGDRRRDGGDLSER